MAEVTTINDTTTEPVTDKLEGIEIPITPDNEIRGNPDAPEYRADVQPPEGWRAPQPKFQVNDKIRIRRKNGGEAGDFTIIRCHRPQKSNERWRYDIQDHTGKTMEKVSESIIFGPRS